MRTRLAGDDSMKPEQIQKRIHSLMHELGYVFRTVSVQHLGEIEAEIHARHDAGSFDEEFFQERLTSFQFHPPESLAVGKSIIMIAVPQPTVVLIFAWRGTDRSVVIPPTYDVLVNGEVRNRLEQILQPEGYSVAATILPLKLLAVRSGLAEYGRNNICYIPSKGSFYRLMALCTDFPRLDDHWGPAIIMKRCANCKACLKACPAGAIGEHRFLFHAERCLTFHNERTNNFPEYVDRTWHHCLFGCLACQKICPENKESMKWVEERERFSEEETSWILSGISPDQVPPSTRQKLERLSLIDDYLLVGRNLSLLLT